MGIFGILGTPLGYVMRWIYDLTLNYGWAVIIFTVLVRVLSFPLQLYQQKSTARMSVFSPMMQEIQKKYKNNPQKQNEELSKLQEEYGYNPTAGCLPMGINFFVLFGVIEVVYRPLQHVLMISSDTITAALEIIGETATNYTAQSTLMEMIKNMTQSDAVAQFGSALSVDQIATIQDFEMNFLGIDLCATPELSLAKWTLLIFPILSVLSMCVVNVITMNMTGQEMTGSMKAMPWLMSLFFVWFCFRVPVAFSLYYTVSNVLMFFTSLAARKVFSPEKAKAQYEEEIRQKKLEKKKKTEVTVTDEKGKTVTRSLNNAEINKLRLERARALDAEKYKDERTEPLVKPAAPKAEEKPAEAEKAPAAPAEEPAAKPAEAPAAEAPVEPTEKEEPNA